MLSRLLDGGAISLLGQLYFFTVLEMRLIVPGAGWGAATAMKPNEVINDKEGVERAKELGRSIGKLSRILSKKS